MKTLSAIIVAILLTDGLKAGNPYRDYLVLKTRNQLSFAMAPVQVESEIQESNIIIKPVPHYQIPTGAVFCRLEDKLTRATKVWIKIGVK